MNRLITSFLVSLLSTLSLFAQADTTIVYFTDDWESCMAANAYYTSKVYANSDTWYRNDYVTTTGALAREGVYLDRECFLKHGMFYLYNPQGKVVRNDLFENDHRIETTRFYENGSKKSYINFKKGKEIAWDETGQKLPGYVVERRPTFKDGWENYLEFNLSSNVAKNDQVFSDTYHVLANFTIDTSGSVTEVSIIYSDPPCPPCAEEVVRVLSTSPAWLPAVEDNLPVSSGIKQFVSFKTGRSQFEIHARDNMW